MVRNKDWNELKKDALGQLYESQIPSRIIALCFGKKYATMKAYANGLGFKRPSIKYTQIEIKILKEYYSISPKDELQKLLPNRTWMSILWKAEKIGFGRSIIINNHLTNFNFLSETDKAYIAGIIDGEGTISLRKIHGNIYPEVSVSNTDLKLMEWLQKTIKMGNVRNNKRKAKNHKEDYKYLLCRFTVILPFLKEIEPYLILKREKAILVIQFIKEHIEYVKIKGVRNYTNTEQEWLLYSQVRQLNQRGKKVQHDDGNYPARDEVEKGRMEKAVMYRHVFAKGGKGLNEY